MNQIILSGNLGKDAEEKAAEFWVTSLATTKKYTNKKTGEQVEQTDWHNINLGGFFKNVIPYLKKGTKVLVTGEQRHTEKDGKYFHFVTVDKLELLANLIPGYQQLDKAYRSICSSALLLPSSLWILYCRCLHNHH